MDNIFRSLLEAEFKVKDGQLMHRRVAQYRTESGLRTVEHLYPTSDRIRFAGRVYRTSHLAHFLTTGEWVLRINKKKAEPRYRAQVRDGAKVVHLGYFASQSERDAAVFAYRLGITPSK